MGWGARASRGFTGAIQGSDRNISGLMERHGRVHLAYPVGGSVTLPFHASIINMLGYELGKPPGQRLLGTIGHAQGLYVADNRNRLVRDFMRQGHYEWLLQIDTDISFPKDLLETMIDLAGMDKRILAASVPLGDAFPTSAFNLDSKGRPGVWDALELQPISMDSSRPGEVDGIATAVVMIHREVFAAIAAEHGQCWFHHMYLPKSPEGTPSEDFEFIEQGEDFAFSVRAKRAGFKIWCTYIPGIKHYKTRALSHDTERTKAKADMDSGMDPGVGEIVAVEG